ncbi:MAG: Rrf2 family transcriptional regulator [Alphaproteobacteria bacterium]|nr:MAG: Rrf2 family transcriptional regulator [Alphaproteobacteria bacterium]
MEICDRRLLHVLDALLWIADHTDAERALAQRRLAQLQGVPTRFLEHHLQRLVRAGILTGSRGPRGGYRLARPAEQISLGEVVAIVRGHRRREGAKHEIASPYAETAILPLVAEIEETIAHLLHSRTLADLLAAHRRAGGAPQSRLEDVA